MDVFSFSVMEPIEGVLKHWFKFNLFVGNGEHWSKFSLTIGDGDA
jgi:hypothetical protein